MRDIKFRVWDKEHKEMINWEQYRSELVSDDFVNHGKGSLVVMQYTGLKDFYDKEIYEGDIYKQTRYGKDNVIWEVIFDKSETSFKLKAKIEKKCGEEKYQDTIWNSVRAVIGNQMNKIGNIYENPELFKEGLDE